ncbi:hypothetical protein ARMSODRAFT_528699 [Armillaria solidipes]|uniref:Uncharacterized protein n=1 Tax=Armillaria solidipes TaxID=1076256 RepID=A0A2H3B281_9AGAR|nr:hypothetical protein ARMSODRAFT_528699 [Armillaria solidipes]
MSCSTPDPSPPASQSRRQDERLETNRRHHLEWILNNCIPESHNRSLPSLNILEIHITSFIHELTPGLHTTLLFSRMRTINLEVLCQNFIQCRVVLMPRVFVLGTDLVGDLFCLTIVTICMLFFGKLRHTSYWSLSKATTHCSRRIAGPLFFSLGLQLQSV